MVDVASGSRNTSVIQDCEVLDSGQHFSQLLFTNRPSFPCPRRLGLTGDRESKAANQIPQLGLHSHFSCNPSPLILAVCGRTCRAGVDVGCTGSWRTLETADSVRSLVIQRFSSFFQVSAAQDAGACVTETKGPEFGRAKRSDRFVDVQIAASLNQDLAYLIVFQILHEHREQAVAKLDQRMKFKIRSSLTSSAA